MFITRLKIKILLTTSLTINKRPRIIFLPISSIIGQFVLSIAITQYVSEVFSINEPNHRDY